MTNSVLLRRRLVTFAAAIVGLIGAVPAAAQAQSATLTGTVTGDNGNALYGANVYIAELSISVGTNERGVYTIVVPAERVRNQSVMLRARSVGRKPAAQSVVIRAGSQTLNFQLDEDVNRLEAIVTTGVASGTAQVKVPFAVSRVDSASMPVVGGNAVQQLQGKLAGATIVSATGRPGSAPSVVLRAPTSINASGRTQGPLYIIDGVLMQGATPDVNPNDIESVEVVKGAAAASLYGTRAGGGVINIRTKSGRNARPGVTFGVRTEYGTNEIANKFYIAEQTPLPFDPTGQYYCSSVTSGGSPCARYIDMADEAQRVNDVPSAGSLAPQSFLHDFGIASNPGRYRSLMMFQANPFPTTYDQVDAATKSDLWSNTNVDVRGNVGNTGFYASASYAKQAGAFEFLDGYQRTTGRLNVDQLIGSRLNVKMATMYSVQEEDGAVHEGGAAFFRLSRQPAFVEQSRRDAQGRLYIRSNPLLQGQQNFNPLYWLENYQNETEGTRFLGSVDATYQAFSWLDLSSTFGYDRGTSNAIQLFDRGFRTTDANLATEVGFIQNDQGDSRSMNTSFNATARSEFIPNLATTFTAGVFYDAQKAFSGRGYGENIAVPGLVTLNSVSVNKDILSGDTDQRFLSYRATADFDLLDRYILNLSVRRDGSSLFGSNERWATYPRIAGAYLLSSESWFPRTDIFSLAKLRAAFGKAGNPPRYEAQYETFTISRTTGALSPAVLGNRDLRPEVLTELETGTDIELFGKYALSVTYARTRADDQILLVPAPASSGFPNQYRNAGQLTNKSWEASLDVPLLNRQNLRWSTRLIYDRNRAVITRLDVPPYNTTGGVQGTESMYFVREGERLGNIYGRAFVTQCNQLPAAFASQCGGQGSQFQRNADGFIVWTGGFPLTQGITNNLWNASLDPGVAPWGVRTVWGMPMQLRDSINNVAQVLLGNAMPDYHAAISSNFSFKKFSAYGLFDGFFGREVFNEGYHWALGDFMSGSVDQYGKSVEEARPIGYYYRAGPAANGGSTGVGGLYNALGPSNESTEDASYVKLRELTVNYNIGAIGGTGNWTVGLVGRNLYTWTKYRGYDPEVGRSGGTELNSSALVGVDYFTFPNLRTYTIQLSTSF